MPTSTSQDAPLPIGEQPAPNGSSAEKLTQSELSIRHDRIVQARYASDVKRYHTWPIIGEQTNGHHVHNMLLMLFALHHSPSFDLIRAVTFHDSAEHIIGDAPSPGLKAYPIYGDAYHYAQDQLLRETYGFDIRALSQRDKNWLNALDKLEPLIFGLRQISLGNSEGVTIVDNVKQWFWTNILDGMVPERVAQYFEFITKGEENAE